MSYLKFRADHLFTGYQWLNDQQVLITGKQGEIIDIVPLPEAGEDIHVLNGILCPGFINCHCHLELSHLKNVIPEKTGMARFLVSVIAQRGFPSDQVLAAIADAETAMLENGIVAVGDICNTANTISRKEKRRLYYHNFIEATGFVEATAPQRFAACKTLWEQFQGIGASNSIVPHAPYSVSPALFRLIASFPGNRLLTMHNQESAAEEAFFTDGSGDMNELYQALGIDISFHRPSGKNSLQTVLPLLPDLPLLLVHNVTTHDEDLRILKDPARQSGPPFDRIYFCLCPNANLYIGNPLPDIDLLRRHGARLTIGTDSLASNHQLSILSELNTLRSHFPHIGTTEMLQWATLNGARALGIEHTMGSFTPGKRPGILLIEKDWMGVTRIL